MKVNVNKIVDIELLDKSISEFVKTHPTIITSKKRYLIMNSITYDSLLEEAGWNVSFTRENFIGVYKGHRIAIDNGLLDGEIEIR